MKLILHLGKPTLTVCYIQTSFINWAACLRQWAVDSLIPFRMKRPLINEGEYKKAFLFIAANFILH